MSKKSNEQKLLADSLSNALSPEKKRGMPRDVLDLYDDKPGIPTGIPATIPATPPVSIPASIPAERERKEAKAEPFTYLDATHTASEKSVYSVMHRETVNKGITERNFGPAELMTKTGIRSRNTVHKALYGLVEKLSVEVVAESAGNPLGPRYRVYRPQEIEQRRKAVGMKIDPQSKKITERGIPAGIPTAIPDAMAKNRDSGIPETGIPGIPNIGTLLNKEEVLNSQRANDDDEAFAELFAAAEQLTGKRAPAEQWRDLASVLTTELRIAAGRTTVSSVPAFLAEHLRRRLWKKDKRQLDAEAEAEAKSSPQGQQTREIGPSETCPDCFNTGLRYHDGDYSKGVEKCAHDKLINSPSG